VSSRSKMAARIIIFPGVLRPPIGRLRNSTPPLPNIRPLFSLGAPRAARAPAKGARLRRGGNCPGNGGGIPGRGQGGTACLPEYWHVCHVGPSLCFDSRQPLTTSPKRRRTDWRTPARRLKASERTIRNWVSSSGDLPSHKIGISRRFDPADVDAFLARFREEGPKEK
jgi:excisionase family DNA binding protein